MLKAESEIKNYIQKKEQLDWDTVTDLMSLDKEIKGWFLSEWLRNDKGLLTYAELAMKAENLNFWESIKFKLLDLKLSLTCSYFSDFKNFLSGLNRWDDNPNVNSSSTTNKELSTEPSVKNQPIAWKINATVSKVNTAESKVNTTESKVNTTDWKMESAVQWGISIANNNSYWWRRWATGDKDGSLQFDCQSFVRAAFIHAWFNVPSSWWCKRMRKDFEKVWFEWIPLPKGKKDREEYAVKNAKLWDIFLDPNQHTELYAWNGKIVWAHSDKDGKAWDSGWEEISSRDIKRSLGYRNPTGILRYKWNVA